MENGIQLDEIKGIVRRRHRSFLIVFFSILVIAAVIALALPPSYLSKSTILIEGQQIPQDYVKSAITTYVEERLETITQQIMSRGKLMEIIEQFGLYGNLTDKYTTEEIITKMREDISLETISADVIDQRTGRESEATIAFSLSYEGKNPATVQKVANKLASLYLEENLRSRTEQVTNTTAFLEQELAGIQTQIDEIQETISVFKSAHVGELPENDSINLNSMLQLERELDQNTAQIRSLQERKIFLQGQLANIDPLTSLRTEDGTTVMNAQDRLRYLRTELTTMKGVYKDNHPDIVRIESTIKELEAETSASSDSAEDARLLEDLTNQRAVLVEKLTPQHPDVVRLDKEISALSDKLKKGETRKLSDSIGAENPDNPAYINIMTQIETAEMDIQALQKEEKTIKAEISKYQNRLSNSPIVEKEYNNLSRDYENAKYKYNEIMNKLMEARVAQGMEQTQRGERFTIIDNAPLPEKPYKPNRLAIALIGFVLAVGGAVGLAAFQESVDESFKSSRELGGFIKAPVLSVMPVIVTDEERRKEMLRRSLIAAGAVCAIAIAIFLIHVYVMPMDILLLKVQRRMTGI